MAGRAMTGRVLVDGAATGPAAVLTEPLSLWGGFDPASGVITDVHHPQHGRSIANTIVVMDSGRGSSSASSVLVEAIRLGTAPAAFLLRNPDEILVLGAIVGNELYEQLTPVVVLSPQDHSSIRDDEPITVVAGGSLTAG